MAERNSRSADRAIELDAVQDLGTLSVPPETYHVVFARNPEGAAILEDLVGRFHDVPIGDDPERTHQTARELGRRDVVGFILRRLAQISDAPAKKA